MRFWFDTEFIDDGRTIELLSIGIVAEDGREYYAEPEECDLERAGPWVRKNVFRHLYREGAIERRAAIAEQIKVFVGPRPEFWAYYGAYDWVALCQLYGTMMDLPKGWPMYVRDVQQLIDEGERPVALPGNEGRDHHALDDARWTRKVWQAIQAYRS